VAAAASASRRLPPAAIALALALLWLVLGPRTPDLAAAVYRSSLFARDGFQLWDNAWYGGHHLLGYSIVFPALGSTIGVRLTGMLAAVVSTVLFERLAAGWWGAASRPAAAWFAVATLADLLIGRLTFGLGVSVGLGALLALQRGRPALAVALAAACSATSPVAGLFLALVATAAWLAVPARRAPAAVAATALVVVLALAFAFPEGGRQPCSQGAFLSVLIFSALVAVLIGPREREIQIGAGLYGLAAILAYALPTPMGGNISRLGAEFAAPLLIGVLATRRGRQRIPPAAALGVLVALAAWQWLAPVREASKVVGDPSYQAAYYAPLIRFLERDAGGPVRVEVPFTRAHWEAVYRPPYFPLARGWQTQLDVKYNALFYRPGAVTADAYRAWLARNAVAYVALPDAPLDPSGRAEARLVRGGLAYLQPAWRDAHWRVFRVREPEPLVTGEAELVSLTSERIVLRARHAGTVLVRVRWTPYWQVMTGGCVGRSPEGWTSVDLPRGGRAVVGLRFSLSRLARPDRTCHTPQSPQPTPH
jgi:hypothetical protein